MTFLTQLAAIVTLGMLGSVFGYGGLLPTAATPSGSGAVATVLLAAPPACAYHCSENCAGSNNHENEHFGAGSGTHDGDDDGHECGESEGGSCRDNHLCGPPPAPAPETLFELDEGFWASMEDASGEAIQRFLANNRGVASFNRDRESIQVLGCGDRITVNVPLNTRQVAYLETALALN